MNATPAGEEIALLAALLRRFAQSNDMGILIIEHNMTLVRALADRVSVLHQGGIIASGPPDAVLARGQAALKPVPVRRVR